ncbi:hypothetical protein KEJ34_03710 [Candidatus Bathyarchaeota archaeon]|nr:hypothetical protein [Candidatus Bathyarchaeota archaeon]
MVLLKVPLYIIDARRAPRRSGRPSLPGMRLNKALPRWITPAIEWIKGSALATHVSVIL